MPTFLACVLGLLALLALALGGALFLPGDYPGMGAFGLLLASGFGLGVAAFASWVTLLLAGFALRVSLGMAGVMLMLCGFLIGAALLLAIGVATLPVLLPLLLVGALAWCVRRMLGAEPLSRAPAMPGPAG